jgi:hypothetical protein
MAQIERCPEHSGFESRIENLETSDKKQWDAIDRIMNRPPAYVSFVYAVLTFLLGASLTYASMAVKIAEMVKKP